ncbi:MAG TPA: response regulator transcription factor [Eubacteriales bacterium]|jgi:DNA-binding response OmpR family regulator|nr:response regulator transcription factor [Clostridia bacterium]HRR89597.1 response regulator transcription factor [Eubacteriales bacterium]HRU84334.1 response regulator transcription factor [Eubacteriales bacterium]
MPKILIVDDEAKIRDVLMEYAEFEGFTADVAEDGFQAVRLAKNNDYDIIIMDIMMPKLDGFSAVKKIREVKDTPVIMLSARSEEYDKLFSFEIGVDDYVVKPFSPREVMARIKAVLKRREPPHTVFEAGGLMVDAVGRVVTVDGKALSLTPKEYDLLFYLVANRGVALTRERLLSEVWGYEYFGDDRTIDTHIKTLRSNLGGYGKFIVTLRGVGYKFEVDEKKP